MRQFKFLVAVVLQTEIWLVHCKSYSPLMKCTWQNFWGGSWRVWGFILDDMRVSIIATECMALLHWYI